MNVMKNLKEKLLMFLVFLVALIFATNAGDIIIKNGDFNISGGLYVNEDVLYVNHTSKKVGINIATPAQALHVMGNIMFADYGKLLPETDSNTYIYHQDDRLSFFVGGEDLLDLRETNQDYVKIGDGGDVDINLNDDMFVEGLTSRVGIGTTAPASNLNVVGEVNITGISNDGTGKIVCIKVDGNLGTCTNDPTSGSGTCTCS